MEDELIIPNDIKIEAALGATVVKLVKIPAVELVRTRTICRRRR